VALLHDDPVAWRGDAVCRAATDADGNTQLSALSALPHICIIDLDFPDKDTMKQIRELRIQYPKLKLLAHSDMDDEKIIKELSGLGFSKYVLIGNDMKKAIYGVVNGGQR